MKPYAKLALLSYLGVSIHSATIAQTTLADLTKTNQVILPPSPNAAALGKFGDIPVSMNTGIPKIGVPVFDWKNANANLSLNISLDYHAGGIKVEEMASDVGLGWALNTGGVISRTMRGLPDELPNGYLKTGIMPPINTYLYPDKIGIRPANLTDIPIENGISAFNGPASWYPLLELASQNNTDCQQDIFSLNCGGLNAKFFIGKDGSIIQAEKSNIKILPIAKTSDGVTNPIDYFKVISEDGTTYVFDQKELTSSVSTTVDASTNESHATQNPYVSSWYLSKIISTNQVSTIQLEYGPGGAVYRGGQSEFKNYNYTVDPTLSGSNQYQELSHTRSYSDIEVDGLKIQRIRLPDSTQVSFEYETAAREDGGLSILKKILITNTQGETHGVQLYHDYFVSTAVPYDNSTSQELKRLRLYQVQEFGGTATKPPYSFSYNTATSLPGRFSFYQDYWGFAIGPDRNALTLIPQTYKVDDGDEDVGAYDPANMISEGTYKEPDSVYAQAFVLNKITYPTGGSTSLVYESNSASPNTSLYFIQPKKLSVGIYNTQMYQDVNLDLSTATMSRLRFTVAITETTPRPTPDPNAATPIIDGAIDALPITVTITNASNTWSQTIFSGTYGQCLVLPYSPYAYITIPSPGIYKVNIQFSNPAYVQGFIATVAASFYPPGDRLIGGLRVKRTIDMPSSGTDGEIIKDYRYVQPDGSSSGKIGQVPNYDYYMTTKVVGTVTNGGGTVQPTFVTVINRSNEPTMPLSAVAGAPVGYLRVEVKSTDPNNVLNNGKSVYTFRQLEDAGFISVYPYRPGQYIDWVSGLPLGEYHYDKDNALKKSVEHIWSTSYTELADSNYRSLKSGLVLFTSDGDVTKHVYAVNDFYPFTGKSFKIKTVEKQYESTGTTADSILYTYDPTYFTTKTIQKTNSKHGTDETRYYYPQDYTGITVFQAMTSANMLSTPVRQEHWLNTASTGSYLTSAAVMEYSSSYSDYKPYKIYNLATTHPISSSAESGFDPSHLYNTSDNYELVKTFNLYDNLGNPQTVTPNTGSPISYQWGYNHTYPVAQATAATVNDMFYEGFEEGAGNSTLNDSKTGHYSYSGSYSKSLSGLDVGSYVLSYWLKSGGIWIWQTSAVSVSGNTYTISLSGQIDDVRFCPTATQMTTYTYDPLVGMTSVTDAKGQTTYYEYDSFQRLTNVKDQNGNILKHTDYHYQNQ